MKKLIIVASILFLVGVIDILYIYSNEDEISKSITKNKEVKETLTKKVENTSKKVEKKKEVIKDEKALCSYEVPKVETSYISEENKAESISDINYDDNLSDSTLVKEEVMEEDDEDIVSNNIESVEEITNCEDILEEETLDESAEKLEDNVTNDVIEKEDVVEESNESNEEKMITEKSEANNVLEPASTKQLKNGFYEENGSTYYYENDIKVTGLKNIDGTNHYFSPSGKYLGTTKVKVVDVSYYQGDIDWSTFASESDCYGVILRLGYYDTLDKKFERNISEVKRLNIPYGIYLFSYSTTLTGAKKEAVFTNSMIDKYDLKPTLGIYYDIESWQSSNGSSSNEISKDMYDKITNIYVSEVSNHVNNLYKVKLYSGRWYAMNRLGALSKSYVDWVAEYNSTLKYDGPYSMWQYTSKGSVPGITGNVDISYLY